MNVHILQASPACGETEKLRAIEWVIVLGDFDPTKQK